MTYALAIWAAGCAPDDPHHPGAPPAGRVDVPAGGEPPGAPTIDVGPVAVGAGERP